jgi:hypothetical protein
MGKTFVGSLICKPKIIEEIDVFTHIRTEVFTSPQKGK